MQTSQHVSLRLGVEIHQGVTTHQEIDAGDRRILDQIVTAEDHRTPQVLVESVATVDLFKIAGQEIRGHCSNGPGVVRARRRARLGERVLIDVGGVNLDPLPEGLGPKASASSMASVYASCPDAQPALHTRIGSLDHVGPAPAESPRRLSGRRRRRPHARHRAETMARPETTYAPRAASSRRLGW